MTDQLQRARCDLFTTVRAIPYATDGAHDASTLLRAGRGDCLAKADYLHRGLARLGHRVRRVRWLYLLPAEPPEVSLLPSRQDVHTAVEVLISGRWTLVDATHDPALSALGLTVATWDGLTPTVPAYPPVGRVWRGDGPEPLPAAWPPDQEAGRRYRAAFNRWLNTAR